MLPLGGLRVDMCMTRWRDFYHRTVWTGLAVDPRRTAPTDGVTRWSTYHAWFASDLPADGSHWKPAPSITAPNIPYPHLINLIKPFAPATTNLAYNNFVKCTPLYHGHPGHALFADLVMSRMSAT
jgi:hypothetical protein